nr:uncharacterized protein LOC111427111 [Onthophagus taurus]
MKVLLVFFITVSVFISVTRSEDIYKDCGESIKCSEDKLIKIIDRIDSEPKLEILDGSIVLEKKDNVGDLVQSRANEDIFDRLIRFLRSHELKIGIPESEGNNIEARKSKLKKFILPLLLILKLKAAIIIPAVLSLITLISFKGLGASIMALSIAGATGLKSLLESHHGHRVSYEVVPQIHAPLWNRAGIENYPFGQGYHTI